MSRLRSLQTRAYDKLPQVLAIKKALEAKTDFPATGELSGGVESRHANGNRERPGNGEPRSVKDSQHLIVDDSGSGSSAPPAQPHLLNLGHVFREVERRTLR